MFIAQGHQIWPLDPEIGDIDSKNGSQRSTQKEKLLLPANLGLYDHFAPRSYVTAYFSESLKVVVIP